MNINFDRIDVLRKEKGLAVTGLCRLINVNRATFWSWKKKIYSPSEQNVRKLAKALDVSVTEISDLQETVSLSMTDLSDSISSWNQLGTDGSVQYKEKFSYINREILNLEDKLTQATTIINALLKSMPILFYIKDKKQEYITANDSFLKNLNLVSVYNVLGKRDEDFFNSKEAQRNLEQDRKVINSGVPVVDIEDFIPGSRKKRWGIISKYPIFDTENRIAGLIGTFVDITERKVSEEIRKALHILLETGPGFSISVWKNGRTLFDESDEKMLEFYSDEMKAKRNEQLDYLKNGSRHPEDVEIIKNEMAVAEVDNNTYHNPFIMTSKIYRFISEKSGTRWVKAIKSGVSIGNSLYTIGCTFLYSKERQLESNSMAFIRLLNTLSTSADAVTWTVEYTDDEKLYFTFISKNFEVITGYSIKDFINVKPNLFTLREHFKESHNNAGKMTPFELIIKKYHLLIRKYLRKKTALLNRDFRLIITDSKNNRLNVKTSIEIQKISGTNTVYFGKAVIEKEHQK